MAQHRAEQRSRHRRCTLVATHAAHAGVSRSTVKAADSRRSPRLHRRRLRHRLPSIPTVVGHRRPGHRRCRCDHGRPPAARHPARSALSSQGGPLSGTDAVGFVGGVRASARSAATPSARPLQDAADARLKAAAEEQAAERNAELKSLGKAAEARAGEIAKNQWQLPTTGYHLTARFGMAGGLWSSNHTGLDFAAPRAPRSSRSPTASSPRPARPAPTATRPSRPSPTAPRSGTATRRPIGVSVGEPRHRRPADRRRSAAPATPPAPTSTSRSAPAAATRSTPSRHWSSTGSRPSLSAPDACTLGPSPSSPPARSVACSPCCPRGAARHLRREVGEHHLGTCLESLRDARAPRADHADGHAPCGSPSDRSGPARPLGCRCG